MEFLNGLDDHNSGQSPADRSTIRMAMWNEMDSVKKRDLIERVRHAQVAITPTISIRTKFLEALDDPVVPHAEMLTDDVLDFWFGTHGWLSGDLGSEARSKLREGVDRQMAFVRELHEAGIPLHWARIRHSLFWCRAFPCTAKSRRS